MAQPVDDDGQSTSAGSICAGKDHTGQLGASDHMLFQGQIRRANNALPFASPVPCRGKMHLTDVSLCHTKGQVTSLSWGNVPDSPEISLGCMSPERRS